jgi:WD40-like Beta Propeller Repeat
MLPDLRLPLEFLSRFQIALSRFHIVTVGWLLLSVAMCVPAAAEGACGNEALRIGPSEGLPDCRAYELVTPPYKEGAPVQGLEGEFAVSPDGDQLVGTSTGIFAGSEEGGDFSARLDGTAYEFTRTAAGWESSALGPPESRYVDAGMYDVSADLEGTLWGLGRLTQPEGVSDLYVERPRGTFVEVGPPTPDPALANAGHYSYLGASADLARVLFSTEPGYRWPFDGTIGNADTLYEYIGTGNSAPALVGVSGGAGSTELVSQCGTLLGSGGVGVSGSMYNAVSASGTRVFFTAVGRDDRECSGRQPPVDELLAREAGPSGEAQTVAISEPSLAYCSASPLPPCADAHFEGASEDGSKVFFTSTQKLLPAAGEGTTNLYEYDFQAPVGEQLTLASAGGASAEVQGVARISEDGSHVYFVAKGVLSVTANSVGAFPVEGEDNLYVYERDAQFPAGRTAFIATLAPSDAADWARADERPVLASQSGRYLVFTSQADLTGEGVSPGEAQVFQYDAQTGVLVRASIGQGGYDDDGRAPFHSAILATQQADAFDSPTAAAGMTAPEDGAVFFTSATALTPQALDDLTDALGEPAPNVYEYRAGSVSLISDGRDTSALDGGPGVRLLGSDPSGGDVFLTTVDSLVGQDTDTQQDIYDARVEGGFPAPAPTPGCAGAACQGPLGPAPTLPVAGSETRSRQANPAASPAAGPGWAIRLLAQPTDFSAAGDAECEADPAGQVCDSYTLLVSNVGSQPANGTVTIADTLPTGLDAVHIEGEDLSTGSPLACTQNPVQCVDEAEVPAGDTLRVRIDVVVGAGLSGSATNSASVAGGGAPTAQASERTTISSQPASFAVADFGVQALDASGEPDTQAGGHPYSLTTSFDFTTDNQTGGAGASYHPAQNVKDIVLDLPVGLAVDAQAAPRCPLYALQLTVGETACPHASRVGTLVLEGSEGNVSQSEGHDGTTTALYNITPEVGYPLELGAIYLGHPLFIYGNVVRMASGYGLRLAMPGVPGPGLIGVSLTLFGDPSQRDGGGESSALLTNPVDCAGGPLPARLEVDTWQQPGQYQEVEATTSPDVGECDALQFDPELSVAPQSTQADIPAGYTLRVGVPQNASPSALAVPDLERASVTLPAGVSLSPATANGLVGCAATGPEGINVGSGEYDARGQDLGNPEASEPGPDGLYHTAPGHCPEAATVGYVEVVTPLLAQPLTGEVFLAQAQCGGTGQPVCTEADAEDGRLLGLYLEAAGSGVILKSAGQVSLNPATGQLTVSFDELPQLPISELNLSFQGGIRALLANPQTCGTATTSSDLSPWSSPLTPDAEPSSSFVVDWNGDGEACPGTLSFEPTLNVGTVTPTAGSFSPFVLTVTGADRQQYLSRVSVQLPPGLAWMFSTVPLCGEPQAAGGACPSESEIGTTEIAAGTGTHPLWLGGRVYLTAGYRGAPYGLSIVVPAVMGPFDLGQVVLRAAISVAPGTGALTIYFDPLPQIIDGIPLRIQTFEVAIDRPEFVLNPSSCAPRQITATLEGAQGASVEASEPFVTPGCQSPTPFSPSQSPALVLPSQSPAPNVESAKPAAASKPSKTKHKSKGRHRGTSKRKKKKKKKRKKKKPRIKRRT